MLLACSGHCSTPTSRTGPLAWSERVWSTPQTRHDPGAGPVLPRFGCTCSERTCAEETLDPDAATLLDPSRNKNAPIAADPVVLVRTTNRYTTGGLPALRSCNTWPTMRRLIERITNIEVIVMNARATSVARLNSKTTAAKQIIAIRRLRCIRPACHQPTWMLRQAIPFGMHEDNRNRPDERMSAHRLRSHARPAAESDVPSVGAPLPERLNWPRSDQESRNAMV